MGRKKQGWVPRGVVPAARLGLVFALGLLLGTTARGAPGDSRTTFSYGVSSFSSGEDSATGPVVGLGWKIQLTDTLDWNLGVAKSSAVGTAGGEQLTANWSQIHTGVTRFLAPGTGASLLPFAGGGFSLLAYDVDFSGGTSALGQTAGTGYGVFGLVGLEIRLGGGFSVVPRYQVSVYSVTTGGGSATSVVSDGLWVSLLFSTGSGGRP